MDKVLILDFDVHHGNGTQHTFEDDPSVMYASIHQFPYYPGTGAASETGIGRGAGATVNCPVPAGAGDEEYHRAFADRILPAADAFAPEFVIVSAGFDAHAADPLAQVRLSTECFGWMTARIVEIAEKHSGGRILSLLEGGYNVEVLPKCVATHLEGPCPYRHVVGTAAADGHPPPLRLPRTTAPIGSCGKGGSGGPLLRRIDAPGTPDVRSPEAALRSAPAVRYAAARIRVPECR